jgi:hypothetical protein
MDTQNIEIWKNRVFPNPVSSHSLSTHSHRDHTPMVVEDLDNKSIAPHSCLSLPRKTNTFPLTPQPASLCAIILGQRAMVLVLSITCCIPKSDFCTPCKIVCKYAVLRGRFCCWREDRWSRLYIEGTEIWWGLGLR